MIKCSKGCIPVEQCTPINKCLPNKILNPKTGRCVNLKGNLGKKIAKNSETSIKTKKEKKGPLNKSLNTKTNRCIKNKNKDKLVFKKKSVKINDPLNKKYRNMCDTGLISTQKITPLLEKLLSQIAEIQDVYCVANNNKLLAALDFSSKGKAFLKKQNLDLINKFIEYANQQGVKYLHNTKKGGMYLKSIFFLPKNYNQALKLMYILWYSDDFNNMEYQIAIGLLLDYNITNIIFFCKDKLGLIVTKKHIEIVKKKIKSLNITLDDLQKKYKIVLKSSIEYL